MEIRDELSGLLPFGTSLSQCRLGIVYKLLICLISILTCVIHIYGGSCLHNKANMAMNMFIFRHAYSENKIRGLFHQDVAWRSK